MSDPNTIRALPKTFSVKVLTDEQVARVHAGALEILERTGVSTTSDRLLKLMADRGQNVDFQDKRIRFSPDFVEAMRAQAPRRFVLAGRHPDRDLVIDGTRGYLSPDGCAPQVIDLQTGKRRASTKADLGQIARLADALPEIGFMWRSVAAGDQPAEVRSLHEMEILFNSTTKHLQTGAGTHAFTSRGIVELCRAMAGGSDELRARPNLSSIQCVISPLFWDEGPIDAIANYAEAGIPISLTSMAQACATGPATMAGLVTITVAELLSGIAILQSLVPGAKAVCAAYAATMDLHSGALNLAAGPDDPFAGMACAQMLEALGLPSASTTFGTGAKRPNWQAGVQTALSAATTAFVPSDLFSGAGGVYASNVFSHTQLLLDTEVFGIVARWAEGYGFDDERIGLDTIDQVGPANHFLGEQHTLDHMLELWRSNYMDRRSWEEWLAAGEPDPEDAAMARTRQLLEEHDSEPLDEGLSEELASIVAAYQTEALEHPQG